MPRSRKSFARGRITAARLFATLVAVLAVLSSASLSAQEIAARWRGLTLEEALRRLRETGLALVYTSELVPPSLRVENEPTSREPSAVLDEILAPHGLAVLESVAGTLVVVTAPPPGRSSLLGTVRSRAGDLPLAGVRVRLSPSDLETITNDAGQFQLDALEPGRYELAVELAGYLPSGLAAIELRRGRSVEALVELLPVPYVEDEIVVRSSELSLLEEGPSSPLALSREDITALPHLAEDAFRALSLLPGTTATDVSAQFNVHGGRRDEVQILLDGQELYQAFHLPEADNALSLVPASNLAGARLTTGAWAASRGDRMSGVLDLTTLEPAGVRHTRLSASILAITAAHGGLLGDGGGSWMLSARRGSIDFASRALGREDPSFWDAFAKLAYSPSESQHLRLHALTGNDRLGFAEVDGEDSKSFDTRHDNAYLWLRHDATLGARLLVETLASWSRFERDRRGIEDEDVQSFEILDRRDFDVLDLGQSWSLALGERHSVEAGAHARRYEVRYDYTNHYEPDFVLSLGSLQPAERTIRFADSFSSDHLGAYLLDRFSPAAALSVELGARYDRHTLSADTLLAPRASLAWRLGELSVLRASWGHYFQSQRPYELGIEDGETRFRRAERSVHWVLGYERLLSTAEGAPLSALRVELYRREVRHPRVRFENLLEPLNPFPEAEQDRVRVEPERGRAEGVELVLRGALGTRGQWWINYARARSEERIGGRGVPRPTDQPHTLNANLGWRLGRHWSVDLAWRYHSGWPTTAVSLIEVEDEDGEVESVPVAAALRGERLGIYHRLDVRLSRRWERGKHHLELFFDVQNLYDRENTAGFDLGIDDDSEPPVLELEPEPWPGIFPSIGFSWQF